MSISIPVQWTGIFASIFIKAKRHIKAQPSLGTGDKLMEINCFVQINACKYGNQTNTYNLYTHSLSKESVFVNIADKLQKLASYSQIASYT